ncbi:MAG TPA: HAMP domain-containing sensor histidine kinase [Kofleriaceae bacterium]|nr:HAMP domain-containing sensor histidine kinase [Kofleriaceae bacterium]
MTDALHGGRATGPAPILPRRFRSLASRLVVLGLGQLVLLAATAVIIFIAEGPHEEADPEEKLPAAVVARLEHLIDTPAALAQALDELRTQRVEISLYDETRTLLASNVDPPLAIPPKPPMRHGHHPPPDDRATGGAGSSDRPPPPSFDDRAGPPPDDRAGGPPGPPPPPDDRAGGPPGPPPGSPDFESAMRTRWIAARHRLILPLHVHGGRGVLVARGVNGDPPGVIGPLLVLIGGVLILVIGALITARWIVRPIERLSRTARALGSGDLQARSRLDRDDEIGELGHRFDEMAERISSLLVTEKELLANVAHELRTPLTRIGVALDLANEGDAEAARSSIVEIAVDVSELEAIVDDILTAMRFEIAPGKGPAQLPLRRAVVPAGEIAAAAADRLRARHASRPLEVTLADDLPAIHVDPVLFRRVIDNLLENAHKYTPDTGSPIELAVTHDGRDGGDVAFEVRDRGVGISAEDLPRIFAAFFRGERSRSRETGGVGLGLTLARRIVEAHDGAIDVTSVVNAGTTVRVTIPATA